MIILSLCLFFFFIQLILLTYWNRGISKISKKNKYRSQSNTNEGVSVVVCVQNQETKIKVLLPALLAQHHSNFEIVVVDINSNDETELFLSHQKNLHQNLKLVHIGYVPSHVTSKKYALTLGIKAASHDIIAFIEPHSIPHTDWLKSITSPFQDNKHIKFSIGYSPYFKEKTLLNRIIQYDTTLIGMQYMGSLGNEKPFMANGKNLAYRKSFFLENKGFGESITYASGHDDIYVNTWANSQNSTGILFKESLVYYYPPKKLIYFWKQKLRHFKNRTYYTHGMIPIYIWEFSQIAFYTSFISLFFLANTLPFTFLSPLFVLILPIRFFLWGTFLSHFHKKSGQQRFLSSISFLDILYSIHLLILFLIILLKKIFTWK